MLHLVFQYYKIVFYLTLLLLNFFLKMIDIPILIPEQKHQILGKHLILISLIQEPQPTTRTIHRQPRFTQIGILRRIIHPIILIPRVEVLKSWIVIRCRLGSLWPDAGITRTRIVLAILVVFIKLHNVFDYLKTNLSQRIVKSASRINQ